MTDNITIQNARVIFRNFAGKADKYNAEGRRNFCVLLDAELAKTLVKDGWNVRYLPAREVGDSDQAYMQVSVSYRNRPPKAVLITEITKKRTYLDADDIHVLDWADILLVDLMISPYKWEVNQKAGIKAYLKKIFITIEEDELEIKYADLDTEVESPPWDEDDAV